MWINFKREAIIALILLGKVNYYQCYKEITTYCASLALHFSGLDDIFNLLIKVGGDEINPSLRAEALAISCLSSAINGDIEK